MKFLACLLLVWPLAAAQLDQGWTQARSRQFWHEDQGSMMMPLDWFLKLKVGSNLEQFGFIPDPDGKSLPIGFAVHYDKATSRNWVGLTCAACHSARIRYAGKSMIVEGAPSMLDFDTFFEAVVQAMDGYTPAPSDAAAYNNLRVSLRARRDFNTSHVRGGFGRVDAFGQIFNDIAVVVLKNGPAAAVPPDAPASYPFLWDIAQHKYVQWNGSAPNLGIGGDGSMMRNVGEVLGVFGTLSVPGKIDGSPRFSSSAALPELRQMEGWISELHAPTWPRDVFPPLNAAMVSRGKGTYTAQCAGCHALLPDKDHVPYPLPISLTKIEDVRTDPALAENFTRFKTNTRQLQGKLKLLYPRTIWKTFQPVDSIADVTAYMTVGVLNEQDPSSTHRFRDALTIAWEGIPDPHSYKARPLDGIWATAPYLHNGSIPNLSELLKKPAERSPAFCLGNVDFDPAVVGYDAAQSCGANNFKFDATIPGNRNTGHDYGTNLSTQEKADLIEFIKSL